MKENSREYHNHKTQPFLDTKRKRKPTKPNKHKSNKCRKTLRLALFPKRGNRNAKRTEKKIWETFRECHNHIPRPFSDPNRKRKPTKPNKHKSNKRTKSTKNNTTFPHPNPPVPKRGNRNAKRTEKHKNKTIQGKTQNKLPRRTSAAKLLRLKHSSSLST